MPHYITLPELSHFNSHARVGRDPIALGGTTTPPNFNSHARVGRDQVAREVQETYEISTHTPV